MLTRSALRRCAPVAVLSAGLLGAMASPSGATIAPAHQAQLEPVAVPSFDEWGLDASMAYDADTHQVLVYGGRAFTDVCGCDGTGGTWVWDGVDMHQVVPPGQGTLYSRLVYDAATHQLLHIAGAEADDQTAVGAPSVWTGSGWQTLAPAHEPPATMVPAAAYDAKTSQLVLFGGMSAVSPSNVGQTWSWTGTDWKRLSPVTSPPDRMLAAMAYDDATGQLVLYGGTYGAFGLSDTWTWNGKTWKQLTPAHSPGPLVRATMTYDPALHGLVLFGGQPMPADQLPTAPAQAWRWTGTDWVPLTWATAPADVSWPSMAYDPDHGQLLVLAPFGDKPGGVAHEFLLLDAPTSTHVTASQASAGAPVQVVATVHAGDVAPPGGTVTFTLNAKAVTGCVGVPLVAGTAQCTTAVPAGLHTFRAKYVAVPGYLTSTSDKVPVTTS